MEITLHTEGWFDSAHLLKRYEGKCSSLHGHTYCCKVWIKGQEEQLDQAGILWDFGNLKNLTEELDHKDLSEKFGETNPTAEFLACWAFKTFKTKFPDLKFKVRIYEQIAPKKSYAEVGEW